MAAYEERLGIHFFRKLQSVVQGDSWETDGFQTSTTKLIYEIILLLHKAG